MKLLPLAALVAAAMLSTLIALDIVWNAFNPDQTGPWLDAETYPYLAQIVGIVHIALYSLLAAALIQSGRAIDGGRPLVRVLRWILISCFATFAVLFSVVIVNPAFNTDGVYEMVANVAFAVSLLLPIVLGFALLRRREFRVPAILLIAPLLLLPLIFVLDAFTEIAHPGYLEIAVNFGLALLCVAASAFPAETMPRSRQTPSRARAAQAIASSTE